MIASPAQLTPPPPAENHSNSSEKATLSPQESTLLTTLQSLRFDPFAFAEQATPEDLLLFLTSPAIQAHLALLQAFAQQALSLRILQAQAAAISHLEQVASTTPNPIEKRRAASTLLRGLGLGAQRTPPRSGESPPSPAASGRGARAAGGEGSVPTCLSTHAPQTHIAHSRVHPHSSSSPHSSLPTSPPLPPPLATPFPTITDENVANLLLPILREPKKPTSIATLRAFCMPTTTFAGIPIPQDPETFFLRTQDILIDPQHHIETVTVDRAHSPSPTRPRFRFEAKTKSGPIKRFCLELARDHPDQPWLISSLAPGINNFPAEKPP